MCRDEGVQGLLACGNIVVVVNAVRLSCEDEQRRSRDQSNYQLPLGNEPALPYAHASSIFLLAGARSWTPRYHVGVALDCTVIHPREFLFVVVVDGLVVCASFASHQTTD